MEEPEDMASMIPVTQVESLLEQQRFVPGGENFYAHFARVNPRLRHGQPNGQIGMGWGHPLL